MNTISEWRTEQFHGYVFGLNRSTEKFSLNSEKFFGLLNERVILESDHRVTFYSGKVVQKSDISISLGGFDSKTLTALHKSLPQRPTDPRKEATAELSRESPPRWPLGNITGSVNNPIWVDSSSQGLMTTDSPTANHDTSEYCQRLVPTNQHRNSRFRV